jgi:LacI family transcriptional regulator
VKTRENLPKGQKESYAKGAIQKPVGIKDIAQSLGVSIGTVDRALHGRGRINPITRDRVLKMAQTLGYRPNLAARYLKSPHQLRISVHLPAQIASFFDALREGIREAAAPFDSAIDLCFRTHPKLGEGDAALFAQALEDGSKGIIIAPGHPAELKPWIRKAAQKKTPVVCVATDAPGTDRLTAVSADPFTSGAIVGELFGRMVPDKGGVGVVTGELSTFDHSEKLRGLESSLAASNSRLTVCAVIEAHDDQTVAYQRTKKLLLNERKLRAIYVGTANSVGVIRAAEEVDPERKVVLVTTDLFPELIAPLRSERILATIHQRPKTQGRMALEALFQYLAEGKCPPPRIRLNPHIVMRSNLDLFLERRPWESEWSGQEQVS